MHEKLSELAKLWREQAALLRSVATDSGADVLEACAKELSAKLAQVR